jgi:isopenicillin N synthase-like dioxygenase
MASATDVPVIDLAPFRTGDAAGTHQVAAAFAHAFEQVGFAAIVNHGIDAALIARAYEQAHEFFRLPFEEKTKVMLPERRKTHGYIPVGVESVAATVGDRRPTDLCEALVFGGIRFERQPPVNDVERRFRRDNLWPDRPAGLRAAFTDYYWALDGVAGDLMRLAALALDLPEAWFQPYFDRRSCTLRAVLYPEQPSAPEDGQLRYGAHRDYGGLTILRQDRAEGALQACLPDGRWIDVRAPADAFVINVGDLMARWTNGRWLSALHRVVNPPARAAGTRRLSLVLFTGPNYDAEIRCLPTCTDATRPPRYPPVRAIDHTLALIDRSMVKTSPEAD